MFNSLPFKNLMRRPARTFALVLLTGLLCFLTTGGSLAISGLKSGLNSLRTRLGADIMVVPYEASTKSDLESIVLQGNPGYFYMDKKVYDRLSEIEGVDKISDQFFLASAKAACCSVRVQLIGFNPDTDFTIQPWVKDSYKEGLKYMEVLVGSDINAFAGNEIKFYGQICHVAGKLKKTGTHLDTAVYMNAETIKTLIKSAKDTNMIDLGNVNPDEITSCVLINVKSGYSTEEVLNDINLHVRKVKAVQSKNMISEVADELLGTSDVIGLLIAAVWILALAVLSLAFMMIMNERKKEFAVLRVAGASRSLLASLILKEAFIVSLVGSVSGALLALLSATLLVGVMANMFNLPFLLPELTGCLITASVSVFVSVLAGSLSSALSAVKAAKIDTALILRDGG